MKHAPHPSGLPFQPEQTFFKDPAIDRLLAMVMTLAAELHVTRDRLTTLEMTLAASGVIALAGLDGFTPTPDQTAKLTADRQAFVNELMRQTLGTEVSLGAPVDGVGRFDRK
jgi:hypothetical protein